MRGRKIPREPMIIGKDCGGCNREMIPILFISMDFNP